VPHETSEWFLWQAGSADQFSFLPKVEIYIYICCVRALEIYHTFADKKDYLEHIRSRSKLKKQNILDSFDEANSYLKSVLFVVELLQKTFFVS